MHMAETAQYQLANSYDLALQSVFTLQTILNPRVMACIHQQLYLINSE